ncbi:MAG: 4Fe-4S binding protein [Promethearchaeota archaeon]
MFPRTKKQINPVNYRIGVNFLKKDLQLVLDRLKCVGCGICAAVCPRDAMISGPKTKLKEYAGENVNDIYDDIILDVSDPTKCVYCGTCTVFCPFGALQLYVDNEPVPISELDIVKKHALPEITGEYKMMKNIKRDAHVYLKGKAVVDPEDISNERKFELEYVNNCPGECHKCVDICPNGALEIMPFEEAKKTGITIKVNEEDCIACGACENACPSGKIHVERTEILTKGTYNDIFMKGITERLGVPLPKKTED